MPPESTPIIVASLTLIGTLIGAVVTWLIARKKQPIDEATAAAANAAALSRAATEMIDAFRADLADFRARIEKLETRDRAWSRFYADLHQRWSFHRTQDTAPTIDA